ncbi:Gfo/Idh/MocA family oxidoreductase [Methylomonas sp. MED-D]|uniref:UDP-N-acetyl-D-glucosamine dehydrogenase n=1 Tax=Methylomonas koyamae TaxID=702114 RepID=A0A177NJV8_9GAMM|nr:MULTISPECIES: Gfo/Idh/MocA family oxidoreductase [Methylomonas]NJA08293.1 Gfo/Idh/MocA family oxidoreductase [Methylococcaceae bacterium WWC4]MDT4331176.1 Gfo/Idh/MocA family oxidoreductase [Methylomonas sp. MV1]OAI18406.1 UDP-N-acetyl-D-glucosamine dehydrogenase [Methylomonas koyamae]OHX37770.1 UDP-N-acetyl-D-glucosamine dehydrogenase [Methylomonas sp. LWB]WGS84674.1 Gfo/Idh/MocA family oxidoreductase [Methylomonas sp. UP202]
MSKLKCAVIGAGYLGKFHAEKYASLKDCELVAVVDINPEAAQLVAEKHGVEAITDYRALLGKVDAVSIVVPTSLHHQVSKDFLNAGTHVLVEKPITVTVEEADELIAIARDKHVILQVGHLERFNPAVRGLEKLEEKPLFIESHRLSPFNPRANDVSVVLDLMIHDIDIILALVDSEIEKIDASGTSVLTQGTDIANARITFKNGCVANVTASRISMKMERKMRMFRPSSYISVDFQNRVLIKHKTGDKEMFPGIPEIVTEESVFESGDALLEEIKHFVACVQSGDNPLVPGEAGRKALATAIEISQFLIQR